MRLGKLCLSGLGIVEAEQSHPQVIVCMGKCRVEAHSFAVTGGGILKFPCVEQCSAEVEQLNRTFASSGFSGISFL